MSYLTLNYPGAPPGSQTVLKEIRYINNTKCGDNTVYIVGVYHPPPVDGHSTSQAFIYKGDIYGNGQWVNFSYPGAAATMPNGIAVLPNKEFQIVGSYVLPGQLLTHAFLYQGGLDFMGAFTTIDPPSTVAVTAEGIDGGLIVGEHGIGDLERAFVYDIRSGKYYDLNPPLLYQFIRATGISHDGGDKYTIAGSIGLTFPEPRLAGFLVNWNRHKGTSFNWRLYDYPNNNANITEFTDLASDGRGGHFVTGNWINDKTPPTGSGAFRMTTSPDGSAPVWNDIFYPGSVSTFATSVATACYRSTLYAGSYSIGSALTANGFIYVPR